MVVGVELKYDTGASAIEMAETIFGGGVTVNSATYSGDKDSSAIFSKGDEVAGNVTPSDTGVIFSTGEAKDFANKNGNQSNEESDTSTNTSGDNNDADFNAIAGTSTYDASFLVVDFTPTDDVMTMQFVFSSEKYPEYINSIYNDMVGVWINGTHLPLSIASSPTAIGAVNQSNNINLYNDNTSDQFNTEMDGFTVTMTLTIPVNVGVINTIKIGIADVADSNYDSNLLIAANSVQTELVAVQDFVTMQDSVTKTVDVLAKLSFGHSEVLVAAKNLVNDHSICHAPGGEVEYVHLLFDQHQVVFSEDLETESFLPGPQTTQMFEADIREEICTIFSARDLATVEGYGPAVRPILRGYEAEALLRHVA